MHARARVAGAVELRLRLLGHEVEQRLDVAALVALPVDGHGAAGLAEPARVPGEHVEAGLAQRGGADVAGRLAGGAVAGRVACAAPAVRHEDGGRALAGREALGRMEGGDDRRAVERDDGGVAGLGGGSGEHERDQRAEPGRRNGGAAWRRWPLTPLSGVARQCAGHAVLQHLGAARVDARSSGTRTRSGRRRASGSSRPARRRRAACRSWRGRRRAPRVRRIRPDSVPVRPAIGSEQSNGSKFSPSYMALSSETTARGEVRLERERPEPSTALVRAPSLARRCCARPARRRPSYRAPPNVAPRDLISVSAMKLSDGTFIEATIRAIVGEPVMASCGDLGGRDADARAAPDAHAAAAQRLRERLRRGQRRVGLERGGAVRLRLKVSALSGPTQ